MLSESGGGEFQEALAVLITAYWGTEEVRNVNNEPRSLPDLYIRDVFPTVSLGRQQQQEKDFMSDSPAIPPIRDAQSDC